MFQNWLGLIIETADTNSQWAHIPGAYHLLDFSLCDSGKGGPHIQNFKKCQKTTIF